MLLDLIDVLDNDGYVLRFSRELAQEPIEFRGESISFPNPVIITGYVKNTAGTIELYANVKGILSTVCARCVADAQHKFQFDYADTVDSEGEQGGLSLIDGKLDLRKAIVDEILSDMPMQVFCKAGCLGLCPKCGADMNTAPCQCTTAESDSVWEKLRELKVDD